MATARSNKAKKSVKSQDVTGDIHAANAPVLAPRQQPPQPSMYALLAEQQHLHYVLAQMQLQKGHLLALGQQQKDAEFLFALAQHQREEFMRALSNRQQAKYWTGMAQQQRAEYLHTLTQQQQHREYFYAYSLATQQQQFGGQSAVNGQQPRQQQHQLAGTSADIVPLNLFQILGEDVHRHILSYLTCLKDGRAMSPKSAKTLYREAHFDKYKADHQDLSTWAVLDILDKEFQALSAKKRATWDALAFQELERFEKEDAAFTRPSQLAQVCKNLSLVSKHWHMILGEVVNSQAPVEILSPCDLFKIKCRARSVALESVSKTFIKDIKEKWGDTPLSIYTEESPLDLIVKQFGDSEQAFAQLVAQEYAKFLVVKSIETIAANKSFDEASPTVKAWKEKCQPSLLVDLFWHAHMTVPQKYVLDCHYLIGDYVSNSMSLTIAGIINHDPGYVSTNAHAGSDYASKKALIFSFENQLPSKDYFGGRLGFGGDASMLFSEKFNLRRVAAEIWEDMQGYNDCV